MTRKRKRKTVTQIVKARWMPDDTTRAQTFADRTKTTNKKIARGRTVRANRTEDLTD